MGILKKATCSKNLLPAALAFALSATVSAAPINQGMPTDTGGLQLGSNNHLGMAKSGRYLAFTSMSTLYVRDIKAQITTEISKNVNSNYYAISPNGRYVAYYPNAIQGAVILDRVTQISVVVPAENASNIGLSDNGYALFNTRTNRQLVRYNIQDQQQQGTGITTADLGDKTERYSLSRNGQLALFGNGNVTQIYNFTTQQLLTLNPLSGGIPRVIQYGLANVSLASSGNFVAFLDGAEVGDKKSLFRLNLKASSQIADHFDLGPKNIRIDAGLSISGDGRFISFTGHILPGHPEFAAALAFAPWATDFPRVFRYDTQLDQLTTMSTAHDGGPLAGRPGGFIMQPMINAISIISDDGSMVEFDTNSPTVSSITNVEAAEANYHAYVSNGFARNYQFVDMPNSDNNFKAFAPMTLVGNNQWEGTISFDGVGTESFKFDVGGTLVNGKFTATANWAINFGAGSTAGQSVAGGGNIPVTGGAGDYTVTFNDQTLKYTITKQDNNANADWKRTVVMVYGQTQTGQDMFIRGGLDHQKALTILGRNCDANNALCSMPIRYTNTLNPTTAPWKQGDTKLDWQGVEAGQGSGAQGSPLDWTTNIWPSSWGAKKTVAINGYGETPINLWGQHYWLLDVEMDCSKTYNGWFELKSFISNGPGWEANVAQANTPWASNNHFAQCGKINVFQRGQSNPVVVGGSF